MSVIPFPLKRPLKRKAAPSAPSPSDLPERGTGVGSLLRTIEEYPLQTALAVFLTGFLLASATRRKN